MPRRNAQRDDGDARNDGGRIVKSRDVVTLRSSLRFDRRDAWQVSVLYPNLPCRYVSRIGSDYGEYHVSTIYSGDPAGEGGRGDCTRGMRRHRKCATYLDGISAEVPERPVSKQMKLRPRMCSCAAFKGPI